MKWLNINLKVKILGDTIFVLFFLLFIVSASFRDIFSVLQTPPVFHDLMAVLEEKVKSVCPDVDIIMGLDSRGFLFGAPLALSLNKPFVPVRKRGKLPGELKQVSYTLEYGTVRNEALLWPLFLFINYFFKLYKMLDYWRIA